MRGLHMTKLGAALVAVLLVALAAVAAATARTPDRAAAPKGADQPTIILGTKNFTEQYVLGQLYKQALEAKGFTVQYRRNIGSTELTDAALRSGRINMYPEYTGTQLAVVFKRKTAPRSAAATFQLAKRLQAARGFTVLPQTPFSDTDEIAVLSTTARRYGLRTIADLKKVGDELTLGGFPEFETREQGLLGVRRAYGVTNIEFVPLAGISAYQALDSGRVLAADVFSTDPPLAGTKYRVLDDPKNVFGFQNVTPVVRTTLARQLGPNFTRTVNAVTAKLTLQAMIAMNKAVAVDKQSEVAVAGRFLEANNLK